MREKNKFISFCIKKSKIGKEDRKDERAIKFSRLNYDFICLIILIIEARAQEGQEKWDLVIKCDQGPMIKGTSSRVIIQWHMHDPRQDHEHVIQGKIKGM